MDRDALELRIEHEIAELRTAYPGAEVHWALLESWNEDGQHVYSLRLDVRSPGHQSVISGASAGDSHAAVQNAFQEARQRLDAVKRRSS